MQTCSWENEVAACLVSDSARHGYGQKFSQRSKSARSRCQLPSSSLPRPRTASSSSVVQIRQIMKGNNKNSKRTMTAWNPSSSSLSEFPLIFLLFCCRSAILFNFFSSFFFRLKRCFAQVDSFSGDPFLANYETSSWVFVLLLGWCGRRRFARLSARPVSPRLAQRRLINCQLCYCSLSLSGKQAHWAPIKRYA